MIFILKMSLAPRHPPPETDFQQKLQSLLQWELLVSSFWLPFPCLQLWAVTYPRGMQGPVIKQIDWSWIMFTPTKCNCNGESGTSSLPGRQRRQPNQTLFYWEYGHKRNCTHHPLFWVTVPRGGGQPNLETFMSGLPLEGAEYQPKPTSGSKVKMYFRESSPGSPAGSSSPKTSKNGILTLSCYSLPA